MIRIEKIYIKGFKDPDREINLVFSTEPISVIYGANGCGKTTLLRVLHAVFEGDDDTLEKENISEIEITYSKNGIKSIYKTGKFHYKLPNEINPFNSLKSICFGTYRGVMNDFDGNELIGEIVEEITEAKKRETSIGFRNGLVSKIQTIASKGRKNLDLILENNHIYADTISINEIEKSIVEQYKKAETTVSKNINNALFETLEEAIGLEGKNLELPDNFITLVKKHNKDLLKVIKSQKDSVLKTRLIDFLEKKEISLIANSNIAKAFFINSLENLEIPNFEKDSIDSLVEIFNKHLYKNKELTLSDSSVTIHIANDQKEGIFHSLNHLSSGERNLLTLLTLFLIIGNDRNFLMIDEPEISLNTKWQRDFLPLLSKINPNAQIIVASHSPSIAHKNSNYLVELI